MADMKTRPTIQNDVGRISISAVLVSQTGMTECQTFPLDPFQTQSAPLAQAPGEAMDENARPLLTLTPRSAATATPRPP